MENSPDLKKTIGKRLHDFRTANHYTQTQFAEIIDVSVNFLSEIENGKKGMSQDTICRICDSFNMSADFLLFGITPAASEALPSSQRLSDFADTLSDEELDSVIEYLKSFKKIRTIKL